MFYRHFVIGTMKSGAPINELTPKYQIDQADQYTQYIRYENSTTSQLVRKVSTSSNITTDEKAIGLWTNRASLTYKPITE